MKITLKPLILIALVAMIFSSCKKNNNDDVIPFSTKSVEENKQIVENSAIEMAQTFDEMKDVATMDAAVSLGNLLDMADPIDAQSGKKSKVTGTIGVLAGIEKGTNGIHDLFTMMKSAGELSDDPESIQEVWDEIVGIIPGIL